VSDLANIKLFVEELNTLVAENTNRGQYLRILEALEKNCRIYLEASREWNTVSANQRKLDAKDSMERLLIRLDEFRNSNTEATN